MGRQAHKGYAQYCTYMRRGDYPEHNSAKLRYWRKEQFAFVERKSGVIPDYVTATTVTEINSLSFSPLLSKYSKHFISHSPCLL